MHQVYPDTPRIKILHTLLTIKRAISTHQAVNKTTLKNRCLLPPPYQRHPKEPEIPWPRGNAPSQTLAGCLHQWSFVLDSECFEASGESRAWGRLGIEGCKSECQGGVPCRLASCGRTLDMIGSLNGPAKFSLEHMDDRNKN